MAEKIDKRRYEFCCQYALLGNAEEAAVKAGYPNSTALKNAADCLSDNNCRELITDMTNKLSHTSAVKAGLRRLAFGECSDAVTLAFADELPPPETIRKMNLFNVSEIKRLKGGGMEIRFFDRLKALEKLYELETSENGSNTAAGLIEALTASAQGGDYEDN